MYSGPQRSCLQSVFALLKVLVTRVNHFGEAPISGAKLEVRVKKPKNGKTPCKTKAIGEIIQERIECK